MNKYLVVAKNSLQEYFVYRLNFILWRLRVIVSILITYFLWKAIFERRSEVFGYSESQLLTYIILLTFLNGIVLSTRTFRVAEDINFGRLSNFLIQPINYFGHVLAKDLSDKSINTFFSIIEMILLIFLLQPPIFLQTNIGWIALFVLTLFLSTFLYFEIGMILSFIGFWSREVWAPQFVFFILVTFLAGIYFPLDIFPEPFYTILQILPFAYLIFFPLKIYLGNVDSLFLLKGFAMLLFWLFLLFILMRFLWRKGLKLYTAEGQ